MTLDESKGRRRRRIARRQMRHREARDRRAVVGEFNRVVGVRAALRVAHHLQQ